MKLAIPVVHFTISKPFGLQPSQSSMHPAFDSPSVL